MSGEELFAQFREMNELGGRALQANNLARAEAAYEEAARISGALARVEPRHDILLAYWHSLLLSDPLVDHVGVSGRHCG